MGELLNRRRDMMKTAATPVGEDYTGFGTVIVKNVGTAQIQVGQIEYNGSVCFAPTAATNVAVGTSKTISNAVTDGTHIWLVLGSATNAKVVRYNGNTVAYKKSGTYWMITIPDNFDHTIPFEVSAS